MADVNPDTKSVQASSKDDWFNSWLHSAKNKTTEVLKFVKKDLEEIGTTVKNEAGKFVTSAGTVLEQTLNLESLDATVTKVKRNILSKINPRPDDEGTEILIVNNAEAHELGKHQKALYELQKDVATYLIEPEGDLKLQYDCWLKILEPDQLLSDYKIAKYLDSSEVLKNNYRKLVPDVVEHQIFWQRYLFKKGLLEDEMARRQDLQEKFEQNDIKGGEQKISLLEEYEKEAEKYQDNVEGVKVFGVSETASSCSIRSTNDDWEIIGSIVQ